MKEEKEQTVIDKTLLYLENYHFKLKQCRRHLTVFDVVYRRLSDSGFLR